MFMENNKYKSHIIVIIILLTITLKAISQNKESEITFVFLKEIVGNKLLLPDFMCYNKIIEYKKIQDTLVYTINCKEDTIYEKTNNDKYAINIGLIEVDIKDKFFLKTELQVYLKSVNYIILRFYKYEYYLKRKIADTNTFTLYKISLP